MLLVEVSVVMPIYKPDKEKLKKTVQSIREQTFQDLELIVVEEISQSWSPELDNERYFRFGDRRGISASLNKGIEMADGKYIARMDADDISFERRIEKQYKYLEQNEDVSVVGTQAYDIDGDGKITGEKLVPTKPDVVEETMKKVSPVIHPTAMMRREDLIDVGMYDPEYDVVEDYELWSRFIANGYKIANLEDKLLKYRVDKSRGLSRRILGAKLRWKYYDMVDLPFWQRYWILLPIALGLTPDFIMEKIYYFLKENDPRTRS